MEEGLILMNLSKYKRWRALLHGVIAKQQKEIRSSCVLTRSGKIRKGGGH